ncbi:alanyl-tRNA editing protein AlaX [Candidatus Woesearchaeota archaeon]|nr:alanyl-tRNA editing protein AlaX [Candidatus Woesearchaeota archaeon]
MSDALYMDDSYLKEFDATVLSVTDDKFVVLDQTAFYPNGGGQPHDEGVFICNNEEYPVVFVGKFSGKISHEVSKPGLKEGDKIKGKINWERRYTFMRMHTAAHIVSAILHKQHNVLITGNQISPEKTRIDYNMEEFDKEKMKEYLAEADTAAKQNQDVTISYLDREEALKDPDMVKLAGALPPAVKQLRIVTIGDIDKQADGGTHVKNTQEIGTITFLKAENKGKNNRRLYYTLE